MKDILRYFPQSIYRIIEGQVEEKKNTLEEIRIRANKPIILKACYSEEVIDYRVTYKEIMEILQKICENSIYSYQNQIKNGFITLKGGHRVGITGNAIIENNKVINLTYISSLNFRIAREIKGCSKNVLKYILNIEENSVYNTLIVSAPGAGKTTILRDIVRNISDGIVGFNGLTVGLIDERGELAATYKGISQNDLGIRTDVIDNIPKSIGMKMLIRSMAPKVIVADEIGCIEDINAINEAVCAGIKGIFTAHGGNFEEILLNPILSNIINMHAFEKIIFLKNIGQRGTIDNVYTLNKKTGYIGYYR